MTSGVNENCVREFRGIDVYSKDWGGVVLHASRFEQDAYVERHRHTHAYACFLAEGTLHERVQDSTSRFLPNTLILHPPGEVHDDRFEGFGFCIDLQFSPTWMKQTLGNATPVTERLAYDHGRTFCAGLRLFHLFMHRASASVLDIEELALELLSADRSLRPGTRHRPSWVSAVIDQIEAEPALTHSLSEWAKLPGVHPVYLARAFRKACGMSLGQYQRHARVRRAVQLLSHTTLPISHIAHDCGFTDQSHLTHLLKRFTGFTPADLRQSFESSAA
jgi:AraC family transcriptional regulator